MGISESLGHSLPNNAELHLPLIWVALHLLQLVYANSVWETYNILHRNA